MAEWFLRSYPSDPISCFCDGCVPRGCSCNFVPLSDDMDGPHEEDEKGRSLSCCEFWYDAEGWED